MFPAFIAPLPQPDQEKIPTLRIKTDFYQIQWLNMLKNERFSLLNLNKMALVCSTNVKEENRLLKDALTGYLNLKKAMCLEHLKLKGVQNIWDICNTKEKQQRGENQNSEKCAQLF